MKFGRKKGTPEADEAALDAPKNKKASAKDKAAATPGAGLRKLSSVAVTQALAVAIIGVAVAAALHFLLFQPAEQERQQRLAQAGVDTAAAGVEQRLTWMQSLTDGLGTQSPVRSALTGAGSERELASELQTLLPGIERVFLFPYNEIPRRSDEAAGFGFATLDLARRAESGRSVRPDAFPRDGQWYIQTASRVRNPATQVVEGTVVMVFEGSVLGSVLSAAGGQVTLVQTVNGQARNVVSAGQGDGPQVSRPLSVPGWTLQFRPQISAAPLNGYMAITLMVGGFVVAAIVAWSLLSSAQSRLRQETTALVQWAHKAFAGDRASPPQLRWEIPSVIAEVLQRLSRAVGKRMESTSRKASPGGRAGARPAAEQDPGEPLFQDRDMPDIDMLDGDDDVLGFGDQAGGATPEVQEAPLPSVKISPEIFRAYDIRGIVGETLTPDVVGIIGQAIGSEALDRGQESLCIGFDGRHSSPELADALARGVMSAGCNVITIGAVPTPVLYFATHQLGTGSGVMVTGSHNPANYNGLKIMLGGETLSEDSIQKLLRRIQTGDFRQGAGTSSEQDVRRDYLDRIVGDIAVAAPLKVVVDAGNGIAGELGPLLLEELGCEVIPLYCKVDGDFPNHHPDPGKPENLEDLIERVRQEGADVGIAFDGDGDRLGVVTNEGKIIWPDRLMMLFARDVVSRNPGADVLFDVKCSRRLSGVISAAGGRPVMWKTGHSLMKAKMKETGALLAGEMSGHIFFSERWYGFDDGLYSAARLLEILGIEDRQSSEVFAEFPEDLSTPEINLPVTEETKFKVIRRLSELADFGEANITTIDGVRVDYPDGWGLCRASNTTPVLVLRFEAETEPALERIKQIFRGQLRALAPDVEITF
ncbi:phosphomannomutase [Marinobacter daqiaonensis]|uniref:phosphomannomutase n=1 Tax=Marinobacter daqiaonensis TaxID=650891 RepID=A0A1I6JS54_9GAMM|nr:phosphomannomutase/phosphoglucomutase [Marinobacter daqiaonensis]SFR81809.1 phosphomannomutase [Marinobacter daqiaonensis]